MTGNQIVAHNLRRARLSRGWKQAEAAERIGLGWSKATYSGAERSVAREDRIRNFDADLLIRLAEAFDLPISYFFERPESYMVRGDLLDLL